MTVTLGKLVYDDHVTGKEVYDDHVTGKLSFQDQQVFSTPLSPATNGYFRQGTSAVSIADAFANMQAASWVNVGFPNPSVGTHGVNLGDYIVRLNASRYAPVIPGLGARTVKTYSFNVSSVNMTNAKLTLAASLYVDWADLVAAPSVPITAAGWIDVPAANALGSWLIVYAESYSVDDPTYPGFSAYMDAGPIRITVE